MKKAVALLTLVCFFYASISALADDSKNTVIPNSYSATITWVTDKPSTSQISYGRTSGYGQATEEDSNLVIYHKVVLNNLEPRTQYQYQVISKDAYGNEAKSHNLTFVTLKSPSRQEPPQISDIEAASIFVAGPAGAPGTQPQNQPSGQTVNSPVGGQKGTYIKQEEPIEKALIQKGGILLRKGKLRLDPSLTYVHTSANKIWIEGYTVLPVLVVGEISTQKVKRDIFIQNLTARYGLLDNLQVELSVPYRFQHDRISVESPASETTRYTSGLGDISAGVFTQIAYEKGALPDLIAGLSFKSRTGREPYGHDIGLGTGHNGIKASLVAVKSSDPAILFGSLGYTYNMKRDNVNDYGTIDPGDSVDYSLGVAFALNYQLALSFQLQQSITQRMQLNGEKVAGSFGNVAMFKYGFTWTINKNLSCDVSAGHGLTTDAPDFVLEVHFPYTF